VLPDLLGALWSVGVRYRSLAYSVFTRGECALTNPDRDRKRPLRQKPQTAWRIEGKFRLLAPAAEKGFPQWPANEWFRIHDVTIAALAINTGKVMAEMFIGDSPFGK
jgi:hypothetical protein